MGDGLEIGDCAKKVWRRESWERDTAKDDVQAEGSGSQPSDRQRREV